MKPRHLCALPEAGSRVPSRGEARQGKLDVLPGRRVVVRLAAASGLTVSPFLCGKAPWIRNTSLVLTRGGYSTASPGPRPDPTCREGEEYLATPEQEKGEKDHTEACSTLQIQIRFELPGLVRATDQPNGVYLAICKATLKPARCAGNVITRVGRSSPGCSISTSVLRGWRPIRAAQGCAAQEKMPISRTENGGIDAAAGQP
ncbi:hypothetical protein JHW43_006217 [Diplocarpon mali]|nr:hypothetical protein JHW43_006217 [Diplocarpon mali]